MLPMNTVGAALMMSQLKVTIMALKDEIDRRDRIWSELTTTEAEISRHQNDTFPELKAHYENRSIILRQQLVQSMARIQKLIE